MVVRLGNDNTHFSINTGGEMYAINLRTKAKMCIFRGVERWITCPDTVTIKDQQRLDLEFEGTVLNDGKNSTDEENEEFRKVLLSYLNRFGFPSN